MEKNITRLLGGTRSSLRPGRRFQGHVVQSFGFSCIDWAAIGRPKALILTQAPPYDRRIMQSPTRARPIARPLQLSITFGSFHGPKRSHSHGCARPGIFRARGVGASTPTWPRHPARFRCRAFPACPVPVCHWRDGGHHALGRPARYAGFRRGDGQLVQFSVAGPAAGAVEPGRAGEFISVVPRRLALRHQCSRSRATGPVQALRHAQGRPLCQHRLPPEPHRPADPRAIPGLVRVP